MFEFMNPPGFYELGEIYGIIVHCADANDPSAPAFVGLGIPSADGQSWLGRPWAFEGMLKSQRERTVQAPVVKDEDRVNPQVKKGKKDQKGSS